MCYSGMKVKESMTTDEIQILIDSYYQSVQEMREQDNELKRQNEKLKKEYEENLRNGINSGCSGVSSSVNAHEFISVMVSQVKRYNPHSEWINMWRKKFKDDPEVFGWL